MSECCEPCTPKAFFVKYFTAEATAVTETMTARISLRSVLTETSYTVQCMNAETMTGVVGE